MLFRQLSATQALAQRNRRQRHAPLGCVVLVFDVLLQELLDHVFKSDDASHVYVWRYGGTTLPSLGDLQRQVGHQRKMTPVLLELVEQVQHWDVRRDNHQRIKTKGLDRARRVFVICWGDDNELLHQHETPDIVLVAGVDGYPGEATVVDLLQQCLGQELTLLQHPGLSQRHHGVLRSHVREIHDTVHDLELVTLLKMEAARSQLPFLVDDEVIGAPAFAAVQLESEGAVPALQWRTGLHVVALPWAKLGRLSSERHDAVFQEMVLRL
mmetsp:Transcript_66984/g.155465  ORF Transcript_66984/g.155465 Transcript_66984/m.155465 type:complete len:268 (+) Transcript_66984:113-916(+)